MEDDKLANHSTTLANVTSHNNGHSGPTLLINGTSNGISGGLVNGASVNSYENALKKLVHILKLKANDNLKQLEDLWDSINAPPPSHVTLAANASRPISKSGNSSNSLTLSPRTTPSPPLFNSSSSSNSSTISESASSPSPTSSSSSPPSPPRTVSSNKPKQPPSTNSKPETTTSQKRDASKLSSTEGQEPKKTKLAAASSMTSTKKTLPASSAVTKTTGAKAGTVSTAKKDDKSAKSLTTAKTAPKTTSKTVKELTNETPKSLKRELDTSDTDSPPERPSSFGNVSLVSVKEEELNKLEEGKSIEITFDAPTVIETSSTTTGSVYTSPGSSVQAVDTSIGNAKRFKIDTEHPSNGESIKNGFSNSSTVNMVETTQVDLDDMLTGLSCSVCKKFNQENNNKLIECRNCKYMFHQLCHRPPLAHDELEEQYISKCFECMNPSIENSNELTPSSMSTHALLRDGSLDDPKDSNDIHSKESSSSNVSSSTLLLNSPGSTKQTQSQQLFAIKGLAALATKFSPAQTPAAVVSSKNNDLFNKFKQSASTTSLTAPVSSPNESSSNNLLAKNKNPFIQTAQSLSATQQQQKRNIFNISSTAGATNAIPVTVATPTGDKRAK